MGVKLLFVKMGTVGTNCLQTGNTVKMKITVNVVCIVNYKKKYLGCDKLQGLNEKRLGVMYYKTLPCREKSCTGLLVLDKVLLSC